jgi:hypothetical protein
VWNTNADDTLASALFSRRGYPELDLHQVLPPGEQSGQVCRWFLQLHDFRHRWADTRPSDDFHLHGIATCPQGVEEQWRGAPKGEEVEVRPGGKAGPIEIL